MWSLVTRWMARRQCTHARHVCGCSTHLLNPCCVPDTCEHTPWEACAQTGVIIQVRLMTSGKKVCGEGFTLLGCGEVSTKAAGHRATKRPGQGLQVRSGSARCGSTAWLPSRLWVCECQCKLPPQTAPVHPPPPPAPERWCIVPISQAEKQRPLETRT